MPRCRVAVVVDHRYLEQPQPSGMCTALSEGGHDVVLIDPEERLHEIGDDGWLEDLDILVARGRTWAVRCLLGWAEARGLPTINRARAIEAVFNKAAMAVMLSCRDIPTPRTFVVPVNSLSEEGPDLPFVLKPVFGDNGRGLRVVATRRDLEALTWPDAVALVQQYLPSDGCDLKLYGIGDQVEAIRKPSPLAVTDPPCSPPPGLAPETVLLTPELRDLGLQCGALFGLELFGVDCIETPEGPIVIEVNEFPNYTGVQSADRRLADYVVGRAIEEREP